MRRYTLVVSLVAVAALGVAAAAWTGARDERLVEAGIGDLPLLEAQPQCSLESAIHYGLDGIVLADLADLSQAQAVQLLALSLASETVDDAEIRAEMLLIAEHESTTGDRAIWTANDEDGNPIAKFLLQRVDSDRGWRVTHESILLDAEECQART